MMPRVTPTTRALLAEASAGQIGLLGIALAHGIALAVAVSIFGPTSGGHFNPAVSFAAAVGGALPWARVVPYWIAQLSGGVLAGLFALAVYPEKARTMTHLGTPAVAAGVSDPVAILLEAGLTLFLVLAVFGTAISPTAPRIAGFGIGLALIVFAPDSLAAVIAGILAITAAALLAMRG